jgi:hypothetical protein
VVAIERPTPRVAGTRLKGRWDFSLGGAHEAGAGAPARFGVRASAAPAVPSRVARRAHAWGGSVPKKEEEGSTGLADARTPPGSEREKGGRVVGLAGPRGWAAVWVSRFTHLEIRGLR